ncbi:hypothetical protein OKA04_17145 [Luteolibacter flavescens]|uniref:Uncharacterized protein n=1 Tax=Luteolibacter flavescens TaxID=1859460 RepID=A0ABT3FSA7_9BACT|nr:hypothetical protein [Luteolibacter flavescens]MCW1886468.1 hypothetical protein [Luteolibacter flavescens]
MTRILAIFAVLLLPAAALAQAPAGANTGSALVSTYGTWRNAMLRKDFPAWQRTTAQHRQVEMRNRIVSEKRAFPSTLFDLPAPPPPLDGLKMIHLSQKGPTAKAAFFGKVDFGVGGTPTDNVLVLSFVNTGGWRYDRADFVNLAGLPDVRKELAAGDLKYVAETPDFQASGVVPPTAASVSPAKYIAKVYVFCPGREVEMQVNQFSRHRFVNAKEAEVVIGGALDGANSVVYTVKPIEGGTGKEALAIRVYLMSEIDGTKPIKAFEYQINEGEALKNFGKGTFTVDAATAAKLVNRSR